MRAEESEPSIDASHLTNQGNADSSFSCDRCGEEAAVIFPGTDGENVDLLDIILTRPIADRVYCIACAKHFGWPNGLLSERAG